MTEFLRENHQMSISREVELSRYREQVSKSLARRGDPLSKSFGIALADLVPGVAFREIWPLASRYSPLRPYFRDKFTNHDYIPRKSEKLTATWLSRALAGYGEVDHPNNLNIAYVGDGESDRKLAENISTRSDGFDVRVTLYLYDPDNVRDEAISPRFRVLGLPTWAAVEEACRSQLKMSAFRSDNFLLVDVDRTLLLPRGLCDATFDSVGSTAVKRFVNWFAAGDPLPEPAIADAFAAARQFPPYCSVGGPYNGDEDVRAIACLFLCANLINPGHFGSGPPELREWLPSSLEGLDRQRWCYERFARYLEDLQISLLYRDCTLALYFREMEHEVMLELADNGRCSLNGHIVRLVASALDRNWTPVAYSDRPGPSVGLELRSYYRSRPMLSHRSLIQTDLPVIFE
jgi:hypothetical protein